MEIFPFFKMVAVHHLGFGAFEPQILLGDLYHCAKFGYNR